MSTDIELFKSNTGMEVRVIKDEKGEPWFPAKDVCENLGIDVRGGVTNRLEDDEKTYADRTCLGLAPGKEILLVNEYGLYSLVLQSRKPTAKAFKRWITHEVIPAIRKHGGYLTGQKIEEVLSDPDTIIKLATDLKNERAARLAAESENAKMFPKAQFYDTVADAATSMDMLTVSKLVGCGSWRRTCLRLLR